MAALCLSVGNMPLPSENFLWTSTVRFNLNCFHASREMTFRTTAIDELRKTGAFRDMNLETDEDEHSIEMHLPYVRKVFEG